MRSTLSRMLQTPQNPQALPSKFRIILCLCLEHSRILYIPCLKIVSRVLEDCKILETSLSDCKGSIVHYDVWCSLVPLNYKLQYLWAAVIAIVVLISHYESSHSIVQPTSVLNSTPVYKALPLKGRSSLLGLLAKIKLKYTVLWSLTAPRGEFPLSCWLNFCNEGHGMKLASPVPQVTLVLHYS